MEQVSQKSEKGISTFGVVLACAFTAALSVSTSYVMLKKFNASQQTNIVTLDSERIIEAKVRGLGLAATKQEAMKQAELFSKQLKAQVNHYTDQGFIVINKRAVIGVKATADITGNVAAALKVTLDGNQ